MVELTRAALGWWSVGLGQVGYKEEQLRALTRQDVDGGDAAAAGAAAADPA